MLAGFGKNVESARKHINLLKCGKNYNFLNKKGKAKVGKLIFFVLQFPK